MLLFVPLNIHPNQRGTNSLRSKCFHVVSEQRTSGTRAKTGRKMERVNKAVARLQNKTRQVSSPEGASC